MDRQAYGFLQRDLCTAGQAEHYEREFRGVAARLDFAFGYTVLDDSRHLLALMEHAAVDAIITWSVDHLDVAPEQWNGRGVTVVTLDPPRCWNPPRPAGVEGETALADDRDAGPVIRPLAHAYLREDLTDDVDAELAGMRILAAANNVELDDLMVFSDRDSSAVGFDALVKELDRTEALEVFTPSRNHLSAAQCNRLRHKGIGIWEVGTRTHWSGRRVRPEEPEQRPKVGRCAAAPNAAVSSNEAQRMVDQRIAVVRRGNTPTRVGGG